MRDVVAVFSHTSRHFCHKGSKLALLASFEGVDVRKVVDGLLVGCYTFPCPGGGKHLMDTSGIFLSFVCGSQPVNTVVDG